MKKILLIEDNTELRESLAELLEISDYLVVSAENGKTGVQKALQEIPDLILCDIMMPELDGYGVLNILEKKQQTADIPFIFLTAKTENNDFRQGMRLGADDYLTKPIAAAELLQAVEMRLKKTERLKTSFSGTKNGLHAFVDENSGRKALKNLSIENSLKKFKEKECIYRDYEHPLYLYFLVQGKVKIMRSADNGKDLIIDIFQAGSFFGYNHLIQEVPYTESAVAMEDSEVSLIHKDEFFNLLYNNRHFSAMFLKMMAGNTLQKEEQLLNLAYSSNRKRVAQSLLYLLQHIQHNGKTTLSIMRHDLANLVGSAKETISRTLSDFREEGLIDLHDGEIIILNSRKLADMPD